MWDSIKKFVSDRINIFKKPLAGLKDYEYYIGQDKEIPRSQFNNWGSRGKYSFAVVDSTTNTPSPEFKEFIFQINPQNLDITDEHANTITPTQSGVVTECNGIIFRNITIQGTTGIAPKRGVAPALKTDLLGKSMPGVPLLGAKGNSGYGEINILHGYLKKFTELKKQGKAELHLEFRNYKDNHFYIVVPQRFRVFRDASTPFLYKYTIQLRAIGMAEPQKTAGSPTSFLKNAFNQVTDAMDALSSVISYGDVFLTEFERSIKTLIEPVNKLTRVLKQIVGLGIRVGQMKANIKNDLMDLSFRGKSWKKDDSSAVINTNPETITSKSTLSQMKNAENKKEALSKEISPEDLPEEQAEKLRNELNNDLNITLTEIGNTGRQIEELSVLISETVEKSDRPYTREEMKMLDTLEKAKEAIDMIAASPEEFMSEVNSLKQDFMSKDEFINAIYDSETPIIPATTTEEVIIGYGDTVQTLAEKYLGSPFYWTSIVALNGLEAPYIDDHSRANVLSYGDTILIPTGVEDVEPEKVTKTNKNLTETERFMATDLLINDKFDLVFNNRDDLSLVSGFNNIKQALKLKLGYQEKEVLLHPDLGIDLSVGERINTTDDLYDEVSKTILSDNRIKQIDNLSIKFDGSIIKIDASVKVQNRETPVQLNFSI